MLSVIGSIRRSPLSPMRPRPIAVAALIAAVSVTGFGFPRRDLVRAPSTPIQHLVVIYGENISFDHYFGTYPNATNPAGEPAFSAASGTPSVNGLHGDLLIRNPNAANVDNGVGASNPFRLDRTQGVTSDQSHAYAAEQRAYNNGAADLFPRYTGKAGTGGVGAFNTTALVMGYFDGNTVTALWNYAQHFAMSDNSYGDQYGPSTPGALSLIAGQTNGAQVALAAPPRAPTAASTTAATRPPRPPWAAYAVDDGHGGLTVISDPDPAADSCSSNTFQMAMTGRNIGDLLTAANVTWGWFQGGFDLSALNDNATTACRRSTLSPNVNSAVRDYVPHHEPFQYYASTANPKHARPTAAKAVGTNQDGGANHQYDVHDFYDAVRAGSFPAVTFLKAPAYENGHAGNSDPLDEQRFVVQVINFLQQRPEWANTAVIIAYDDSDGWYDHQMAPISNASFDSAADQLTSPGNCGTRGKTPQLGGTATNERVNGRCGPGARQPFLVISPWARVNYVDHTLTIQSSIIRFIEDNWLSGTRIGGGSFDATAGSMAGLFDFKGAGKAPALFLDPELGTRVTTPPTGAPR